VLDGRKKGAPSLMSLLTTYTTGWYASDLQRSQLRKIQPPLPYHMHGRACMAAEAVLVEGYSGSTFDLD
jgi:hypothetical protein